jgi:hypothetical protein
LSDGTRSQGHHDRGRGNQDEKSRRRAHASSLLIIWFKSTHQQDRIDLFSLRTIE